MIKYILLFFVLFGGQDVDRAIRSNDQVTYESNGGYNEPLEYRAWRRVRIIGGRFNTAWHSPEVFRNSKNRMRYRFPLNDSHVSDQSYEDISEGVAIFNGGIEGTRFANLEFRGCSVPAFDTRSKGGVQQSNTLNRFEMCQFRKYGGTEAVMRLQWPQVIEQCWFEDGSVKAIHGSSPTDGITVIRDTTFEQFGDDECVIRWERGTLKLVNCRLGWCPRPKYYFSIGPEAKVILVDSMDTYVSRSPANPNLFNAKLTDRPRGLIIINQKTYAAMGD